MSEPHLVADGGGTLFAIVQSAVREIVPARRLTRLPGAPAAVRGLLNVRGTMVTALDLASHFALGESRAPDPSVVIAVTAGRTLGLLVDDVLDVVSLGASDFLPPSSAQRALGGIGLGHFGDRIVLAVDLQELARLVLA